MGQPERQPEGPPQDGRGRRAAGPLPGDLAGRPFPPGDWAEPAERLEELYRWVERGALETVTWYLADRTGRRRTARALRAGAALGAVAAAAVPLLCLAADAARLASWGYLPLLLGGACVAADRFFGVTSGWMRDVAAAQAVQRRLQIFQFDWAAESVREVLGPTEGTAGEAAEHCLAVLRRFSDDMTELVRTETTDWMVEFRTGSAPLGLQQSVTAGHRPDGGVPTARHPAPPGARPNMPRQRPPEPR